MKRWKSSLRSESGAELVEFALVLPLLLMILLGIVEMGFLFQRYEVVTNAAREGARIAVLTGYTTANITARVDQYIEAAGLPGTATTSVSAPQNVPVGGGACVTVKSITVTYPYQFLFVGSFISAFSGSTNLTAVSSMRTEAGAGSC